MIRPRLILAAGLMTATAAHAHDTIGPHGGRVTDAGPFHVELVASDETVAVYLSDRGQKPVPAAGFRGTAILVVGGKPVRVPLMPADGNRLTGQAAMALGGGPRGAVQLTGPDGASASGRFD